MGTYLNWIIQVSDKQGNAVLNPVTENANAHNHIKRPTHQVILKHGIWRLLNKPQEKLVHCVHTTSTAEDYTARSAWAAYFILLSDPDPVIINIHDNNDDDIYKFGALNTYTKWKPFLKTREVWLPELFSKALAGDTPPEFLAENWKKIFQNNSPLNMEEVYFNLDKQRAWLDIRIQESPDEVFENEYNISRDIKPNTIFDINMTDIMKANFIDKFAEILALTDSAEYDFTYAKEYHQTYVKAQNNFLLFDAIKKFREDGVRVDWWDTNPLTKSFFILETMNG